jgi:nitric oxide dioxygenase
MSQQTIPTPTLAQIRLLQSSFAKVAAIAEAAAAMFYARLFEQDPGLQYLFRGNMVEQGRKLMQTLAITVHGLDDAGQIVPLVEELGRQHVRYGVREKDYASVGAALLWTLERGLGEAWTPEVRDAWVTAYGLLSGLMLQASRQAAA